jgi:hypothetical protein
MAKELSETFHFLPSDYDVNGIHRTSGQTFRSFIAKCEFSFHEWHSTEYAWMLYANSRTMSLLAKSNGASENFIYGMDLTKGKHFHPVEDPFVNGEMDKHSKFITVYGIDSAFMTECDTNGFPVIDEETGIYPLTLLVDNTMRDGTVRLAVPDDDSDSEKVEPVIIDVPHFEYV